MIKLEENISEWKDDDVIKLKALLEDLVPLIRFNLISSDDLHKKIEPYKGAIDKEFYEELCQYFNYTCHPNPKSFEIIASQMHKLNLGPPIEEFPNPKCRSVSLVNQ